MAASAQGDYTKSTLYKSTLYLRRLGWGRPDPRAQVAPRGLSGRSSSSTMPATKWPTVKVSLFDLYP